jgi:hypothetical protein
MGSAARARVEAEFAPEQHLRHLECLYVEAGAVDAA